MFNLIDKIYLGSATPNTNSNEGDQQPITTNYNDLTNKPTINNIALIGNKSLDDLGIQAKGNYLVEADLNDINSNIQSINSNIETNTQAISTNTQNIAETAENLNNKADKATTLAGYGIQDAYNKLAVDNLVNGVKVAIPTKTSQLDNDSNFTNTNYVDIAIGKIKQFNYEIVESLSAVGKENTIYLVKKQGDNNDIYNEYMWINNRWELIGNTAIDLTDYSTKEYVDNAITTEATARETADNALNAEIKTKATKATTLSGYGITDGCTKTETDNLLANKVDKVAGKGLSTNDFTTAEKNKLSGIATGAQVNKIENIKVNGIAQTITDKSTNIIVPTYDVFTTAVNGLVPKSATSTAAEYLNAAGSWSYPTELASKIPPITHLFYEKHIQTNSEILGQSYLYVKHPIIRDEEILSLEPRIAIFRLVKRKKATLISPTPFILKIMKENCYVIAGKAIDKVSINERKNIDINNYNYFKNQEEKYAVWSIENLLDYFVSSRNGRLYMPSRGRNRTQYTGHYDDPNFSISLGIGIIISNPNYINETKQEWKGNSTGKYYLHNSILPFKLIKTKEGAITIMTGARYSFIKQML